MMVMVITVPRGEGRTDRYAKVLSAAKSLEEPPRHGWFRPQDTFDRSVSTVVRSTPHTRAHTRGSVLSNSTAGCVISPQLRAVFPDAGVVVQGHGEMVRHQVLGRAAEIHRVPVFELSPAKGNDFGKIRSVQ